MKQGDTFPLLQLERRSQWLEGQRSSLNISGQTVLSHSSNR